MVAAGNSRDRYIISPAKGWNVITVGGINDQGTTNWSDDVMYQEAGTNEGSSYLNPGSPHSDREKPEVVAPGQSITSLGLNNVPQTRSGTSHATPQVAGLAALLMHRNSDVKLWPTAVKAIVMASSVHNIEGDSRLSGEDGAGSIDAALADTIVKTRQSDGVTCSGPCWWAVNTTSSYPNPGVWLYQYFKASRGEKIRVAIAWWSQADPPPAYPTLGNDVLTSDFDLYVWSPSGALPQNQYTASWDNNYEIVEFVAQETGTFKIGVYKDRSTTESSNQLGIAWVKDATYLPDLRGNKDGWVSTYYLRNDGATARNVNIHYFRTDGSQTPQVYDVWDLNPASTRLASLSVGDGIRIPAGTIGSAIVDGGEDVTVVVETQKNSQTERTNYSSILPSGGSGSPGWEQAGAALYAPVLKRQRYGRSSTINIFNAGAQMASEVHVDYFEDGGATRSVIYYNVNPNSTLTISDVCTAAGRVCSAKIYSTNGQLLAGVVQEYNDADGLSAATYNLFSAGATPIYFPLAKFERYSMSTGLRIQNVGNAASTVTVNVYEQNGNFKCALPAVSVPVLEARTFLMNSTCPGSNFSGSVVASAGQPLVGMAHEVGTGTDRRAKGYSSFQGGSHTVIGPLVYHTYAQAGYTWDSGIAVQNLSNQQANVNLYYYYDYRRIDGDLAGSQVNQTIASRGMKVFFAPVDNFRGSVIITADRDIAAVINVTNNAPSGDTEAIYNASNR